MRILQWAVLTLVRGVLVVWLAASAAFVLLHVVPGDAARTQAMLVGRDDGAAQELRTLYGLDRPLWQQYGQRVFGPLWGDFGLSFFSGQSVSHLIVQRAGPTVSLALSALGVAIFVGALLGLGASADVGPVLRATCRVLVMLSLSVPLFWSGTVALYAASTIAVAGGGGGGVLGQGWLPALVLGLHTAGPVARVVEAQWLRLRQAPFLIVARGKGLPALHILLRHGARHLLLAALPVVVLQLGFLLGGAVITESLFARPGLGRLLLEAVSWQDFPVVQALVVLGAAVVVALSNLADGLAMMLDPRLRG